MRLIVSADALAAQVAQAARPSHIVRFVSPEYSRGHALDGVLTLVAHDVTHPAPSMVPPDAELIERLIRFAEAWTGERPLMAQCWAGVSRSTAAALIVASLKRPQLDEGELAARLRYASPQATPNRLMIDLADTRLGRAGRLSAAAATMGRGEEFQDFASCELTV